MTKLFANPTVRLAGRALVAAAISVLVQIETAAPGTIIWRACAIAGGLAFVEVFTPLNALVGFFKQIPAQPTQPTPVPVTAPPNTADAAHATEPAAKKPTSRRPKST